MKPTKHEQMIECMEELENGMIRVGATREIWQNDLIWWICKSLLLVLGSKVNEPTIEAIDKDSFLHRMRAERREHAMRHGAAAGEAVARYDFLISAVESEKTVTAVPQAAQKEAKQQ